MNPKVLVADDEQIMRIFFESLIQKENLPVSELLVAESGRKAVSLALEKKPDIIFMDIRMPSMNGLQACAKIKADWPEAEIYIISAYNEFDYAKEAFKAGVRDYLLKPFRPAQIMEIIKKKAAEKAVKAEDPVPLLVRSVAEYVKNNLDQPLALDEIARAVFISPSYLSRRFKQLTGQPLTAFIRDIRLQTAAELLKTPDISVTEVAQISGFNSSAYFSNCFRAWSGVSPQQYRRPGNATRKKGSKL